MVLVALAFALAAVVGAARSSAAASGACVPPPLPSAPNSSRLAPSDRPELLRDVLYAQQEGMDLLMDLLLPRRPDGVASPVLFYPSANGHAVPKDPFTEAVRQRGYAVVRAQVRYYEPSSKFPDALVDAKSAVRFLKAHASEYGIDPERIVACGSSKNGMFASMLGTMGEATQYDLGANLDISSRVAAVVNFAGHTDLTSFYADGMADPQVKMDEETYEAKNEQFLGCPAFDCLELERAASAITYADPSDAPQMLVLGSEDALVPSLQMTRFLDRLLAVCVSAYYILVDGAPHAVAGALRESDIQQILAFLETFVE
ncbi:MAG: alpha/beta hydrolase [Candidatus Bipolaricaulota bacterium]